MSGILIIGPGVLLFGSWLFVNKRKIKQDPYEVIKDKFLVLSVLSILQGRSSARLVTLHPQVQVVYQEQVFLLSQQKDHIFLKFSHGKGRSCQKSLERSSLASLFKPTCLFHF